MLVRNQNIVESPTDCSSWPSPDPAIQSGSVCDTEKTRNGRGKPGHDGKNDVL